jgi:hypothetical protein
MIDYKGFFEELKECYEKHLIEFNYDLRAVRFKDEENISNKVYSKAKTTTNQVSNQPKQSEQYDEKYNKNDYWIKKPAITNPPPIKRIFRNFENMVYYIALNLAEKIGRLPDHLHSRMILSIDNDEYLKTYVRKFG